MRVPLRMLFAFSFVTNLLLLAPAVHMLSVYDRVLTSRSIETLIYITLIVVVALGFYAVAEIIRGRLAQRLSTKYMIEHAEDVFDHLVHDSSGKHEPNKALRDLNTVRGFLSSKPFINLFDIPFFPVFVVLMFLLHVTLGLVAVVGILMMVGVAWLNHKTTKASRESAQMSKSDATNFSLAVMRRTDDIRAMGLLPSIMNRWGRKTATSLNSADDANVYSSRFYGISRFVRQALQVGTMAWGAYLVLEGSMSGGMIFASSMLLGRSLMPVEQLIGSWEQVLNARQAHNSIMDIVVASRERDAPMELPDPVGRMSVEDLSYHPGEAEGRPPILDNVSFQMNPGEVMVVMGPSGAGKSTLARLMVGAMRPTSGTVRLDDFDIEQWPNGQRGAAIGYVPQDIMLFPGTIAENIARLAVQLDEQRIVAAAKMAGVHDMIAHLPDGYSTVIGPNTVSLSGGQRQRIALARAFYSSPKVLVLDEPNAHLDRQGEQLLMESLKRARENGVSVLIVSQRRGILAIADRVLLVEGGKARIMERQDDESGNYFAPQKTEGQPKPEQETAIRREEPAMQPREVQQVHVANQGENAVQRVASAGGMQAAPVSAAPVSAAYAQPASNIAPVRQTVTPPPLAPQSLPEITAAHIRETAPRAVHTARRTPPLRRRPQNAPDAIDPGIEEWMNDPLFDEIARIPRHGKPDGTTGAA